MRVVLEVLVPYIQNRVSLIQGRAFIVAVVTIIVMSVSSSKAIAIFVVFVSENCIRLISSRVPPASENFSAQFFIFSSENPGSIMQLRFFESCVGFKKSVQFK